MIWFFLAGMIAGAVGWNMFCSAMARRAIKKAQMKAFKKEESDD